MDNVSADAVLTVVDADGERFPADHNIEGIVGPRVCGSLRIRCHPVLGRHLQDHDVISGRRRSGIRGCGQNIFIRRHGLVLKQQPILEILDRCAQTRQARVDVLKRGPFIIQLGFLGFEQADGR